MTVRGAHNIIHIFVDNAFNNIEANITMDATDYTNEPHVKEQEHVYMSLHLIDNDMGWILYRQQQIMDHGVMTRESYCSDSNTMLLFLDSLLKVWEQDGFVVAYHMQEVQAWLQTSLEGELWERVRKCSLVSGLPTEAQSLDLFRLVDNDCYEIWSLEQLHEEIYGSTAPEGQEKRSGAEKSILAAAELVGEIFYWYVTRFEAKILSGEGFVTVTFTTC